VGPSAVLDAVVKRILSPRRIIIIITTTTTTIIIIIIIIIIICTLHLMLLG
jgi:hypothetical protein